MICHRCNVEVVDEVELAGTSLVVCREHLLSEDRRVIDYAHDRELVELERDLVAQLERIRRIRGEIRERRFASAREAVTSGWWGP